MSKFCTKCGKPLEDGEQCNCKPKITTFLDSCRSFVEKLVKRMGIFEGSEEGGDIFERNKKIVPDVIKANDGEEPVKQYEVATLRSRIRGQYSKGRLQVTNKRVIFRAVGASYKGGITVQHEFALEEIAGVEVKISNRVSPLNIVLGILSAFIICPIFSKIFRSLAVHAPEFALFLSIFVAIGFAVPFFLLKKKFWLKFLSLNCGMGCLIGTSSLVKLSTSAILFGFSMNIADFVGFLFSLLWLAGLVFISIVPDLTLCVKTKGASDAFNIRRKQHATIFKQEVENTGFSEVVPGKDAVLLNKELGTLINDLRLNGDAALADWRAQ